MAWSSPNPRLSAFSLLSSANEITTCGFASQLPKLGHHLSSTFIASLFLGPSGSVPFEGLTAIALAFQGGLEVDHVLSPVRSPLSSISRLQLFCLFFVSPGGPGAFP